MRKSKVNQKLKAGKPVQMCSLGHFNPPYIRHASHCGFDCIWLDTEHRAMEAREIQSLMAFFHLFDIDCMLRPPTLEPTLLYRYLEDGATGLMIPFVSTPEKARMLVDAVRFPPLGNRGMDSAGLDNAFNPWDAADYAEQANQETFLVVQIETPEAVENIDQIAAVEGVDGLFIGPADLSLRLRHSTTSLTMEAAIERVAEAAAKHGKAWGQPVTDKQHLQDLSRKGAQLLPYGNEFGVLKEMLEKNAQDFSALGTPSPT